VSGGQAPDEYVERLRFADKRQVFLEQRYVVTAHRPTLIEADLRGSLYGVWKNKFD